MRWLTMLRLAPLALLTGCYTIVVDDITVMEDDYIRARNVILDHAAADMSCPRDELDTTMLSVTVHANVETMEVSGCEQRRVYRRTASGFEADGG